jgi:Apea-like HEPN
MATQPDDSEKPRAVLNPQLELAVSDLVRNSVPILSKELSGRPRRVWRTLKLERGNDGHFRAREINKCILSGEETLHRLPKYQDCIEALRSDPTVGKHLNALVGTSASGMIRLDANSILDSLIYSAADESGSLKFDEDKFHRQWNNWSDLFVNDNVRVVTVAVLPYLKIDVFPLRLNQEVILDRLTDDEVNRCFNSGVFQPQGFRPPFVPDDVAVGVRNIVRVPKEISTGGDYRSGILTSKSDDGSFGRRPVNRGDLLVDDILSAMPLFRHTNIRAVSIASWVDSDVLNTGTSSRPLGSWLGGGGFELTDSEVHEFRQLWRVLEKEAGHLQFSIHRFNLAFERRLIVDRLVDLVIAAESLFLSDIDDQNRGELVFRFALRAAKYIEVKDYSEQDIFHVMREAYNARSTIVHGGTPKRTRLPHNQSADLHIFTSEVERLVRTGLRKALAMAKDAVKLRRTIYWEELLFSKQRGERSPG